MDERLTALLLGDLPAEQAAELRAHLAGCDACRSAAAEIEATLNLLRGTLAAQAAREPAAFLATGRLAQIRLAAAHPATPPVESTAPGRFWHLLVGTTDREKQARRQLLVWASAASFVAAVFLAGLSLSGTREKASRRSFDTEVTMEELKIKELSPEVIQLLETRAKTERQVPSAGQATEAASYDMATAPQDPKVIKELTDTVATATVSRGDGQNMDIKPRISPLRIPGLYTSRSKPGKRSQNTIAESKDDRPAISAAPAASTAVSATDRPTAPAELAKLEENSRYNNTIATAPGRAASGALSVDDRVRVASQSFKAPAAKVVSGPAGEPVSREIAAKTTPVILGQAVEAGEKRLARARKKLKAPADVALTDGSERLSRSELGIDKDAVRETDAIEAIPTADKPDSASDVAQVAVAAEADAGQAAAAALAAPLPLATPEPEPVVIPAPPPVTVRPFVTTRDEAFSTFAIDVDTAAYALARAELQAGRLPVPESVRVEEFVNAFDYDYTPPAGGQAFAIDAEFAPSPFRPSLSLLKIGVKGAQLGRANRQALMLTVILDASGSMNSPDRLGLARQALKELLGRLRDDDRIALVQFSAEPRLLLEATPAARRQTILAALDGIQAAGSTHLENGLRTGYAVAARAFRPGAANRVLFLSDGVANLGAADADSLLKAVAEYRRQGICLSVYGVGSGAYNDALLEQLADKGDGTYTFFDSLAEARRVLVDQFDASMFTIAKDVKIQVEFNPVRVTSWRQIGYDNRQLTKEQFRDDSVDAGEIGAGQAVTALYELALAGRGDEALGTVRVRYRDPVSGAVREIQQTLTRREGYARFALAPPRFRLAAGVAEFAELLRGSPFVDGSSLREVDAVLQPVALDLKLDGSVQELVRLLRLAERMRK
jgi:Ca-activated chloride channel family protein